MKRPSFQFYPADWRNNAKLRRCSEGARGVWMDVLCVLHDSDEYGVCRWPLADLARAANASLRFVRELVSKEVLKGDDALKEPFVYTPRHAGKDGEPVTLVEADGGPCWYSSRLVRDEWVRLRRGTGTRFTEEHQPPNGLPKATPKGGIGGRQGDGPTSTSSSTSTVISSDEEITRSAYPALKPLKNISFDGWPSLPSAETMAQWLVVRKNKRATNTQHAMDLIRSEIQAADFCDVTAEECIRYAVEKSWCGFQWAWIENELKSSGTLAGASDPFSVGNSIANKIRAQAAALQRARKEVQA